ncbi:hypothetical protein [Loktanella sp. Alg231-35]|uniref:hypothetical protein n=1 Tax=Loktanella sp. Alg231-35 TaxID=1922220 RepID=UPI00131F147F|nr:hypothetical protein [Loktanella sp. Alg231-35]
MTAFWLIGHLTVKRRFGALNTNLSDIYRSAVAVPPEEGATPRLIALCIDLMRKEHCTDPFEDLSAHEQKMALHAHAVEALPSWMSKYAALGLSPHNRALIKQMHQVKSSRPAKKPNLYYGAVRRQQQLRSASKT